MHSYSSLLDSMADRAKEFQSILKKKTAPVLQDTPHKRKDLIIPLGCADREFSTGVLTYNLGKTGVCAVTGGGGRGVGKSVFTGTMYLDCLDFVKMHRFMVDPKPEFYNRRNPTRKFTFELDELNRKSRGVFDIRPKGHKNLRRVTPACLYDDAYAGSMGVTHQLTAEDMTYSDILTLFGLAPESRNDAAMIARLDEALFGGNGMHADHILEMGDVLGGVESREMPSIEEIWGRLSQMDKETVLKQRCMALLAKQAVGRGRIGKAPILDYLSQGMTVIFQTAFGAANKGIHPILCAYVSNALREIIKDRDAWKKGNKEGKLRYPVCLYFGEYDVYFPNNKTISTTPLLASIYDNMRFAGVHLWADCSHFYTLNPVALEQSDVIFTFKPTGKDKEVLKKTKGLSLGQIYQLDELVIDKKGIPPAQIALIPRELGFEEPLLTFWPIPPMSDIQEEDVLTFNEPSDSLVELGFEEQVEPKAVNPYLVGGLSEAQNGELQRIHSSLPKQRQALIILRDAMDKEKDVVCGDLKRGLGIAYYPVRLIKDLEEKGLLVVKGDKYLRLPSAVREAIKFWA